MLRHQSAILIKKKDYKYNMYLDAIELCTFSIVIWKHV